MPQVQLAGPVAAPAPGTMRAFDPALLDTTADACTDFYQFACGGWIKQNPIPADRASWGRETELRDRNDLLLKSILERAAGPGPRAPELQKMGDAYTACMDTAAIEQAGMGPLQGRLALLDSVVDKHTLTLALARLEQQGDGALFDFGSQQDFRDATQQVAVVTQARLGLADKGFYERTDTRAAELRSQYQAHVARTLALAGEAPAQASKDAVTVLRIESALAAASLSRLEMRDPVKLYHKTPLAQFAANTPGIDFPAYLRALGAPTLQSLNVEEPSYFLMMSELLTETPLEDIKAYLRWTVLHQAPETAVPAALAEEDFRFYGRVLGGQQEPLPRWKRCVARVDADLGDALGQAFVAERFGTADRQHTLALAIEVESAMRRDIDALAWMSAPTKAEARDKLREVVNRIGYPETWRDYSSLTIDPHEALGNALRAATVRHQQEIAKIGKRLARGEWMTSAAAASASYDPQRNDVNLPAGILQPPYFDPGQGDAAYYGASAAVIGHELTHAFDDEGRLFDGQGNLRNWWTRKDASEFAGRADCLAEEYSAFALTNGSHVDGRLTLGEDLADLGGLRLAYLAYLEHARKVGLAPPGQKKEAGARSADLTSEQQFFAAYGQAWCESRRPEQLRTMVETDPHAPEVFRVNGVVRNLPEFAKAFGCKAGQAMAPVKRCSVW
ncbi:MAG TPA: M13 family metallopeptidase [Acidobacteriaceae bacterium]